MSRESLRAVRILFDPGQVVEVRAISDDGTASGYFDDLEKLAALADVLDGTPGIQGIYVTLNEVNPALLARRSNRVKMRLSRKEATTADSDILRRRWLPIDVDPVRPSGVSSTSEEHAAALERAAEISACLTGESGWPAPILADSGNGAHLLFRVDLPNDEKSRDLVKRCLEVLSTMFGDEVADVDTANHNAARIWKLYGTMSRKGDDTADRPHRRSAILNAPPSIEVVPRELLEALAASLPAASPGSSGKGKPVDLGSWLREHGIGVSREKRYEGGTLYVLDECPFSGAHRDGAFAIRFPTGAVHAGCQHASCGGGSQRWQELREKYEQGRVTGKTGGSPKMAPPPSIPPEELPGDEEALAVLEDGDPKRFMLDTFALDHEGDRIVAESMILSFASRSVENTNGLHVSVSGESGKGKSHAFSTMLSQVPGRFRPADRMSNKALFYANGLGLIAGSAVVFDDSSLSEEMAEILKSATSNFRRAIRYWTVSRDRKGQECTIPERCVWWVAKVEGVGDDQVFNRMLTCWIDDSAEQDDRCVDRSLHRDAVLPVDHGGERPEILVSRAMWDRIGAQRFHVVIPYALRIRFRSHANRRNPEMLLDLIKANAVMRFAQREQALSGRIPCLMADVSDFTEAARLYGLLNGTSGGQETKLTRKEAELLEVIRKTGFHEFTIPELQTATRLSNGTLYKVIHGYKSRGCLYSGLLEKCPAISYTDRSVIHEEEPGLCMRRRTNAYTFDRNLYDSWTRGGEVWLDSNDGPGDPGGDDGPGCPAAPAADFCNPAATAAGIKNDSAGSDSPDSTVINNIFLSNPLSFRKREHTQGIESAGPAVHDSLCDPQNCSSAEVHDSENSRECPDTVKKEDTAVLHPAALPAAGHHLQQCSSDGPRPPETGPGAKPGGSPSAESPAAIEGPPKILAKDYKLLDVPEPTPCFACGGRWSHYTEKLTGERRKRPDPLTARKVCKKCYLSAKKKAQKAVSVLPGSFDPGRLEHLKSSSGRCTICDLDPASYIDRATGTKVCESCYRRVTTSADGAGVRG